jgi:hypothetical protein
MLHLSACYNQIQDSKRAETVLKEILEVLHCSFGWTSLVVEFQYSNQLKKMNLHQLFNKQFKLSQKKMNNKTDDEL